MNGYLFIWPGNREVSEVVGVSSTASVRNGPKILGHAPPECPDARRAAVLGGTPVRANHVVAIATRKVLHTSRSNTL
jgi:hypothetical protein